MTPLKVVKSGLCIGCGSCVAQSACPSARMEMNRNGLLNPVGVKVGEADFTQTCPFLPNAPDEDQIAAVLFAYAPEYHPSLGRYRAAYVGAAAEQGFRDRGSSGGMVSWVAAELLRADLVDAVAHVKPSDPHETDRFYQFGISRTVDELNQGAKSRYYPVEMSGILREIRQTPGRYAIVAIPCFVKAINLLRRQDPVLRERIVFTLGLFCGHMKSARLIDSFAHQMGTSADELIRAEHRIKDPTRPASTYTAEVELTTGETRRRDWWNMVDGDWGSGFFMANACNFCDDVVAETADVSFGDAWVEPYSSDGRGTNVVVVRDETIHRLIERAIQEQRLELKPVDAEFVHQTQAAGFRQRREGLAYRLTWPRLGYKPRKRVEPSTDLPARRKLIYLIRAHISKWSHITFRLSPQLYFRWGRFAVGAYHGLAYSRGRFGEWLNRIGFLKEQT